MDLINSGKFIQQQRKAKNLTQVELAQILNVSEKTISKWECGNGFPDVSLMLPLCKALDITANELLSAKKLSSEEYKLVAEKNLVELKIQQEKNTKHLLSLEWVIGLTSSISFFIMIFCASFAVENVGWRITLILAGLIIFVVGLAFAIRIEQEAGFYECGYCHYKYVPTYRSVLFSSHYGRTRYMKCPKCHKRSWNKKTINKEEQKNN
ncbi:MAG: helix-turn-helix domain-containing protein [Christensenellales bacterium]